MLAANEPVHFPLIELTEWVFVGEQAFTAITEDLARAALALPEGQIDQNRERDFVDSQGWRIRINGHRVVRTKRSILSWFGSPVFLEVIFDFVNTGQYVPLDALKQEVLIRVPELIELAEDGRMTTTEFIRLIESAEDHAELIRHATFQTPGSN
ncbi:MAG: hypothetical protein AAGB22_03330 [Bacteroidota bacterium]